jgi:hypothetical protein
MHQKPWTRGSKLIACHTFLKKANLDVSYPKSYCSNIMARALGKASEARYLIIKMS